jgi:hypothetical protein
LIQEVAGRSDAGGCYGKCEREAAAHGVSLRLVIDRTESTLAEAARFLGEQAGYHNIVTWD